ncbi:unnamed protein product [Strongylus vulgaris]|uniref:GP-PDE domain-containing protein n=1 Tax=Strongylus vulgaris TaxID=40348 RepID=A0A3P7KYY7_STRVU|nr:unnamed protein product [Strongylus vulgaris]
MAALKLALENRNTVMFDVRLANDGAAVVIRDETTGRTAKKDVIVSKTPSTELIKLTLRNSEEHIPLFKDVMDWCRKKGAKVVIRTEESPEAVS